MSELALLGGKKAITKQAPAELFKWPIVTKEDEEAVLDVLRKGTMSGTDVTQKFEREFADWMGQSWALGFCNGTVLGVVSALLIGLYIWLLEGQTLLFAFATSGCIGVAMLVAMTVSGFIGTAVPLLFKRVGVDPAVASGPLITTFNDLVAVVAYYGLAWLLLLQTLQLV